MKGKKYIVAFVVLFSLSACAQTTGPIRGTVERVENSDSGYVVFKLYDDNDVYRCLADSDPVCAVLEEGDTMVFTNNESTDTIYDAELT